MYSTHISKKKRTVSLLTAVLMVLTMSAAALPEDAWAGVGDIFTVDGIKYTITADDSDSHTVKISGYENAISGDVTIPDKVKKDNSGTEYTVSSIGNNAFFGCTSLTSVIIPGSVTSIGTNAFTDCTGLTSVTIPDSVTSIGFGAFDGCTGLTSIIIPGSVISIGLRAFKGCSGLRSIIIPDSVTSIENYAFQDCSDLTSVFVLFASDPSGKAINSKIIGALSAPSSPEFYRGWRQFGNTGDLALSLVQGSTCDLVKEMDITDTVYEGTSGGSPATGITLPFTLSGNTSAGTTIDAAGVLHTASDETGTLTIDAGGRKAAVTVESAYVPPAIYYSLTAEDLAFPDLQYGDSPQSLPLTIRCTGNGTASISRVETDSASFLVDAAAASPQVSPGTTNTTYRITPKAGLAPGTYTAVVTVTYGYGRTAKAGLTLTVTEAVQAAPAKLTASSKSCRAAALSWKKADRAEGYQIWRSTSKNGAYRLRYSTKKTSTVNTGLSAGKAYYYKVRAYRTVDGRKVYSAYTAPAKVTPRPSAPSFTLRAGKGRITASWKGVSGATGYRIYRASARNGKFRMIRDAKGSSRSYTSTNLKRGRTYYYKIRAYRTVNGKKVYGTYSAVKKITTR